MSWVRPIILEGELAALEPLAMSHAAGLAASVGGTERDQVWSATVPTADGMAVEIERRLGIQATGWMIPFAVIDRRTAQPVGMTNYMNPDAANRRLEIGGTWYASPWRGTLINLQCKYLLLEHAFEGLGCIAVELRTHVLNQRSRRAIEKLGAKLDGVLRSHQIMPNGTIRDTCVYSLLAHEWPASKSFMRWRLDRGE